MCELMSGLLDRSVADGADERGHRRDVSLQPSYYRRRAEDHRRMAERAVPEARAIHAELADAYTEAALAAECGKPVDLGGEHRAEPARVQGAYGSAIAA